MGRKECWRKEAKGNKENRVKTQRNGQVGIEEGRKTMRGVRKDGNKDTRKEGRDEERNHNKLIS